MNKFLLAAIVAITSSGLHGCFHHKVATTDTYMKQQLQEISYPNLQDASSEYADDLIAEQPPTISNYKDLAPWDLTLEEAIKKSLQNSEVLQKLGGLVVDSPQVARTVFDPAIQETDPRTGTEAALSAFDAQLSSSYFLSEDNQVFFSVGGGSPVISSQARNYRAEISKQTASGTSFALRNQTTYSDNGTSILPNTMNTLLQAEVRQPLLRGLGTDVNRIAGPNAQPGVYNGVLISRINGDISLADFEAGIRDLVRDVEQSYWELYFAYRDLDAKLDARESSRQVWVNRKARLDNGLGRPDEEAQARQQYFSFERSVETALTGQPNSSLGVFGAERQLRRLMGIATSDGSLIRPIDEPAVARVIPDWKNDQGSALDRRVELRRQKWSVRQRELEVLASRNLNKMRLDFVGQYGYRGIEEIGPNDRDLFGIFSTTNYNENWNVGVELSGPIGKRIHHTAQRNAELRLAREKALLREQQRQILHELNEAYTELDRAFASIKSNYNNLVAVEEELEPKRRRAEAGEEDVFFLLETQQRATSGRTAFHRAIVDYNIALLNYSWASGNLLDRYQISLAEGPWSYDAYYKQNIRHNRLGRNESDYRWSEKHPVRKGPYLQHQEMFEILEGEQEQQLESRPEETQHDEPQSLPRAPAEHQQDALLPETTSETAADASLEAADALVQQTTAEQQFDEQVAPVPESELDDRPPAVTAWQAALQSSPSLQPRASLTFDRNANSENTSSPEQTSVPPRKTHPFSAILKRAAAEMKANSY